MRKTKTVVKEKKKEKIIKLPISKFIDTKFREYSVYVLESRGIPNFFDGLTPVQRYILMNSPSAFVKTLSVVGKAIEDGYHHGDSSLQGAISKLARPFCNSFQVLEGYGFFGTEVSPEPAAARYTSVKISAKANEILKKYKNLFTRDEEGPWHPFWIDLPIGLSTPIVGIAVGYKTTILPRKLEDVQKFLEGKIKEIQPYFKDFNGKIERYKTLGNAWLLSSILNFYDNKIEIREIPPMLKYTSALKKLDHLFNKFEGKIRIVNNSNTKVNVDIVYLGKTKVEWDEIKEFVSKTFSIIVTENVVLVKDSKVLVYDNIEQYLTDYKWQLIRLKYQQSLYDRDYSNDELIFNKAKKEFITFMISAKRTNAEIDTFLLPYPKDVGERLERLTARKFTKDEILATIEEIKRLEQELKDREKILTKDKDLLDKTPDPTIARGVGSRKTVVDLFDIGDINEHDGITIWDGGDIIEEKKEEEELVEEE